ncbi:MAG: hypothetical protein Q4A69_05795 [Moraxella sp.]|nr:hypothetical protein [Moraxella sp.]
MPVVSATLTSAPSEAVLVAKVNFNPIFVGVSDAMGFGKQGDDKQAKAVLIQTWQVQALSLSEYRTHQSTKCLWIGCGCAKY